MAKVTIGGTEYDIPPFRFRQQVAAGPFIDRFNALWKGLDRDNVSLASLWGAVDVGLEILAVAASRSDATITADKFRDEIETDEQPGIPAAVMALCVESGLNPKGEGEAAAKPKARSPRKPKALSPS